MSYCQAMAPGGAANGNFILTEFSATSGGRKLPIKSAMADHEQPFKFSRRSHATRKTVLMIGHLRFDRHLAPAAGSGEFPSE